MWEKQGNLHLVLKYKVPAFLNSCVIASLLKFLHVPPICPALTLLKCGGTTSCLKSYACNTVSEIGSSDYTRHRVVIAVSKLSIRFWHRAYMLSMVYYFFSNLCTLHPKYPHFQNVSFVLKEKAFSLKVVPELVSRFVVTFAGGARVHQIHRREDILRWDNECAGASSRCPLPLNGPWEKSRNVQAV